MNMRAIEIDFDVHKAIEGERKSFEESPNEVLKRLLKLSPVSPEAGKASMNTVAGKSWASKGVTLPHGTELKMEYNGVESRGVIENGKWVCDGLKSDGPSPAAAMVATTKSGSRPSLNGWIYWYAKLPGSSRWVAISTLRKR